MVRCEADALLLPRDELALALDANAVGREGDWAGSVACALAELQEALRQHIVLAETTDGIFGTVDLTRPTLVRQMMQFRREHNTLMDEVHVLQQMVRDVARAFQPRVSENLIDTLPENYVRSSIPDFGALRERGQHFLAKLSRHEEGEDMVVMESVAAEIGTGD